MQYTPRQLNIKSIPWGINFSVFAIRPGARGGGPVRTIKRVTRKVSINTYIFGTISSDLKAVPVEKIETLAPLTKKEVSDISKKLGLVLLKTNTHIEYFSMPLEDFINQCRINAKQANKKE